MNSNNIAIKVENLSKRYRIGMKEQIHDSLGSAIIDFIKSPLKNYRKYRSLYNFDDVIPGHGDNPGNNPSDIIWALRDVSFEVERGEVIGIIGRNGAGKSTLLKILSRITDPTNGHAEIRGRVSSLLEVGTGFHPELTGRENIYLNATILGMTKKDVDRKFDEIVGFSGVGKFIDTPIKRYSSGMKVRLAFSVAAHLEPEILIIDEVLAVGDVEFQKKCLGKMGQVAKEGRTIIFVSHNMAAVSSLCTRTLLIEQGAVSFDGTTNQTVTKYLSTVRKRQSQSLDSREDRVNGENFRFTNVTFLNPNTMVPYDILISGQPTIIRIEYLNKCSDLINDAGIGISFCNEVSAHLFTCRSRAVGVKLDILPGKGFTDCLLSRWPLKAGHYSYHLYAERGGSTTLDWVADAGFLDVEHGDYYGSGCLPAPSLAGVLVDYTWQEHR